MDDDKCAIMVEVLKAIAHPIRLQIIARLCEEPFHVKAIADQLGVNQAIISQQLRILRMNNLVRSHRENGLAVYEMREPGLSQLIKCLTGCCH